MTSSILVIDVGTSGLRAAIVRPDASVDASHYRSFRPTTPAPGLVEFDATEMARLVLEVAHLALAQGGPVSGVGITTQRASTIIWDRNTGVPIGPGLGWQDLRTVIECIMAKAEHGLALKTTWVMLPLSLSEPAICVSVRWIVGLHGRFLVALCTSRTTATLQ